MPGQAAGWSFPLRFNLLVPCRDKRNRTPAMNSTMNSATIASISATTIAAIAAATEPSLTAAEISAAAAAAFAAYQKAMEIGDEVAAMLAAASFHQETRRRLLDVSMWHVQYSEGGNTFEAEFTGDGTAVFRSRREAEEFIAEFRGAWVGGPYHPFARTSLRGCG